MSEAGKGCRCIDLERATRRDVLTIASVPIVSVLGVSLASDAPRSGRAGERAAQGERSPRFDRTRHDGRPRAHRHSDWRPAGAGVADGSRQQDRSQGFASQQDPAGALDPATLVGVTTRARGRRRRRLFGDLSACRLRGQRLGGRSSRLLECSCQISHYNPREAAAVIDGPTPRALAALPLEDRGRQARRWPSRSSAASASSRA